MSNVLLGTFCIAIALSLMDMFLMMQEKYGLVGLGLVGKGVRIGE